MRIKEIELVGFKSFVDKTKFSFNEGICAVVGPNGCGKSNIVDAIRWCMGEMSAKSLRGSEMQDVIFNGSESRKPMGMAQVTIVFDCEDGRSPAGYEQFSEIQVTRRLYRSGESEYLINQRPCRLKDIIDLFLDTGVGSRSYSVIEQGQIAKILAARPLDRRQLIEEAAGISKYRVKKEEAERKIDATRTNLNRVEDVIYEIRRNVNSLQRQANKAKRYHEFKAELKELDFELAARDKVTLAAEQQRLADQLKRLKDLETEARNRLEAGETRLATLRLEALEQEKAITAASERVGEIRDDVRTDESQRELMTRDIEHLEAQITLWNEEIETARQRIGQLDQEKTDAADEIEQIEVAARETEARSGELREKLDQALARRRELDTSAEAARKELLTLAGRQAALERAVEGHQERLEAHTAAVDENRQQQKSVAQQKQDIASEIEKLTAQVEQLQQQRATIEEELNEKKTRLTRIREEADALQQQFDQAKADYEKANARLESLEQMRRNLEGYQRGVQRIMQAAREQSGGLNGSSKSIIGVLAEKINVEQKFETALEAVLGDRLQAVLVTDQDAGAHAVDYLKTENAGRSSFVPMQPRMAAVAEYPDETTVQTLGPLASHVSVEPQYMPVTDALLDNVLVVEDLPTAVRLHKDNGYTGAFVTLDGELVDGSGIITGGAADDVSSGILQKKREIEELSAKVAELETTFKKAEDAFITRKGMIARLEETVRAKQTALDDSRIALSEAGGDLRRANEERQRLETLLQQLTQQADKLAMENVELFARQEQETKELADLNVRLFAAHTAADEKKAAQAALGAEIDSLRQDLHASELQANNQRQEQRTVAGRRDAAQQARDEAAALVARRNEQIERARQTQNEHREKITVLTDALTAKTETLELAEQEAAKVRVGVDEKFAAVDEKEGEIKLIRRDIDGYEEEIKSCELSALQNDMKRDHLAEKLQERYQQSLDDLPAPSDEAEMDTDALKTRQQEINERIGRMGEVNPNAIEEYEEEKKRYDTYMEQKEDLESAIEELRRAIAKINKTSKERFTETFDLVNAKFAEVIPLLFGGGSAQLVLVEPEKPLESGVDIIIRPPGKKLQNVNLLSGGEKALSSIGLIFSIFLIRPSPFCLLDEVDAPLDDENVYRFNTLIEKMAEHSQVILITHNKSTMECVDSLYGVTMQEQGVSKLVSVRLVEEPPRH